MRQIHFFRGEHAKDAVMRSMRSGNGEKCSNIRPKSDSGMISEMRSHAVTCGRIRDNLSRKRQASTCFRGTMRNMRHMRHMRHPLSGKGSNYGTKRHFACGLEGTINASPCVTCVTRNHVGEDTVKISVQALARVPGQGTVPILRPRQARPVNLGQSPLPRHS